MKKHDTVLNLSALYLCFPQFIRAYSLLNLIIQNIWDEKTLDELHQTTSLWNSQSFLFVLEYLVHDNTSKQNIVLVL